MSIRDLLERQFPLNTTEAVGLELFGFGNKDKPKLNKLSSLGIPNSVSITVFREILKTYWGNKDWLDKQKFVTGDVKGYGITRSIAPIRDFTHFLPLANTFIKKLQTDTQRNITEVKAWVPIVKQLNAIYSKTPESVENLKTAKELSEKYPAPEFEPYNEPLGQCKWSSGNSNYSGTWISTNKTASAIAAVVALTKDDVTKLVPWLQEALDHLDKTFNQYLAISDHTPDLFQPDDELFAWVEGMDDDTADARRHLWYKTFPKVDAIANIYVYQEHLAEILNGCALWISRSIK